MKRLAWCLLAVLALPVAAQPGTEDEPVEVEVVEEEPGIASRLTAAGWCVLATREEAQQKGDSLETPDDGGEDETPVGESDDVVGCDFGIGAALLSRDFRQGRLSLVGVLGAKSLGIGGAWTFGRQGGRPLSVAVGLVAPYDSSGVYAGEWAVALGATVSVLGQR